MDDFWTAGSFWSIVTPIIAFLSLGINIFQIIKNLIEKQRNLFFCVKHIHQSGDIFDIQFWANNLSSRPISLVTLRLSDGNQIYDVFPTPLAVSEETNISNLFHKSESEVPPILLLGYCSHIAYLSFKLPIKTNLENGKWKLMITTSKGKNVRFSLIVNKVIKIGWFTAKKVG